MYQFKKMYKTEDKIGNGQFIFRRYSSQPIEEEIVDERFVAFMNGELTELIPSDFGSVTTIPADCLSVGVANWGFPLKIILPDTVTTIKEGAFYNSDIVEIIFPSNITTIEERVCNINADGCIYDFSKAKRVPTLCKESNATITQFLNDEDIIIKVPSRLYNTWINSTGWDERADRIVSV